jgi:hypothetical protein
VRAEDAFPSKFLRSADVKIRPLVVIVSHVEMQLVGQGPDQVRKPVLIFEDEAKPMVLNRTNFEILEGVLGDSDNWSGHRVKISCGPTKFQGKTVDGLRVAAARTAVKPPEPVIVEDDFPEDEIPL